MIDLTPLDVRQKAGDFSKALRGYDPEEVDSFLQLTAERLEELVKENLMLKERTERLQEQVESQEGRERAVQEALVTAQKLREDVHAQAEREASLLMKEAEARIERRIGEAEGEIAERRRALEELERRRLRFLKAFRALLRRELEAVEVEEEREPLGDVAVELDLGEVRTGGVEPDGASPGRSTGEAGKGPGAEADEAGEGEGRPPAEEGSEEEGLWLSSILRDEEGSGGDEVEERAES